MKKLFYFSLVFVMLTTVANAAIVVSGLAQTVGTNYYKQHTHKQIANAVLAYTETAPTGDPVFYVFNMNDKEGFVIVSAENDGYPIIGYSTEGNYLVPSATSNPNFYYWMQQRKSEIIAMRAQNAQANTAITNEWANYISNKNFIPQTMSSVAQLVQSTWNQNGGSPAYNSLCPGGSVTGCVATAMAQIMRFWKFPAQGIGFSSYTAGSYGTLSVNYASQTYNWTAMPLTSSSSGAAQISYDCGVSVQMNYSPSGSGAYVITADDPSACAQISYVQYFGYDPTTIQGLYRSAYTDAAWIALLENDLNLGRPIQYVGDDPSAGGHTWVCDGYDASNNFHMNWGWAGSSDGYFSINNLATPGFNPSTNHEALIGIQPKPQFALDAGIASVVSPGGTSCSSTISPVIKLQNYGTTALTSCTILYHIDANSNSTYNWTGSLATGISATVTLPSMVVTAGAHTFTSSSSNPNSSTDANTANDQNQITFNIASAPASLPLMEGFESSAATPSGWSVYNPDGDATWQVVTTVAHTGTNCIGMNNCDGDQTTDMTGKTDRFMTTTYDFSNATSSSSMTFDVGYIPAYDGTKLYTDTLAVYASTDCGTTWSRVYIKGGTQLATGPQFTISTSLNCVAPTSSQWRTDVVSLGSYAGQQSVMFAFENRSDWGNWIYLDNINISMATGVASIDNQNGFRIYPNPAKADFTIEGTSKSEKVHYSICNMLGSEIKSGDIAANGNSYSEKINVSDIATGMYFIKVIDGNSFVTKKLNKQ